MTICPEEFELMVEDMTSDLISLVVEREGLSIPEAFNKVYMSPIYDALRNPDSRLYFQSPGYVYSCICQNDASKLPNKQKADLERERR